jgi:RNA-binding protein 25
MSDDSMSGLSSGFYQPVAVEAPTAKQGGGEGGVAKSKLGFSGKLGAADFGAAQSPSAVGAAEAAAAAEKKRKKLSVEDVFNNDEDEDSTAAKKRRLVPLVYSAKERAAVLPSSAVAAAQAAAAALNIVNKPTTAEEKRKCIKNLIERIPTAKDELFAYKLDWTMVDSTLMDRRIKPWVNKKIVEYIGEDEPTLSEFICKKVIANSTPDAILADISMVLDDEAEVFVVKMWRLLIYETEAKKLGLVK